MGGCEGGGRGKMAKSGVFFRLVTCDAACLQGPVQNLTYENVWGEIQI
jgi:hypothetical protein